MNTYSGQIEYKCGNSENTKRPCRKIRQNKSKRQKHQGNINMSSIYLESDGDLELIDRGAMESDFTGADMKNPPTNFERNMIYHL